MHVFVLKLFSILGELSSVRDVQKVVFRRSFQERSGLFNLNGFTIFLISINKSMSTRGWAIRFRTNFLRCVYEGKILFEEEERLYEEKLVYQVKVFAHHLIFPFFCLVLFNYQ